MTTYQQLGDIEQKQYEDQLRATLNNLKHTLLLNWHIDRSGLLVGPLNIDWRDVISQDTLYLTIKSV